MQLYGGMNKGERNRIKVRVRSAMAAQAQHEGRFLGGRPPYGHELVDAGPHPNPSKAYMVSGSVALSVILPPLPSSSASSPSTSGGSGIGAIAEGLNRDHIPSPSGHDPARNRHRASANGAWARALRGRSCRTRAAPAARCGTANAAPKNCSTSTTWRRATGPRKWNKPDQWIWSDERTHEPLISYELCCAAQRRVAEHREAVRKPRVKRTYCLSSLIYCGECGCGFRSEFAGATGKHPR